MALHLSLAVLLVFYCYLDFSCAVLDLSNTTRQSSVFNEFVSGLAVDGDITTCAKSGFETDSWWIMDLGNVTRVLGINVAGSSDAIHIRVGNGSESLGVRRRFDNNGLCKLLYSFDSVYVQQPIYCDVDSYGQYISIQSVDNIIYGQLRL